MGKNRSKTTAYFYTVAVAGWTNLFIAKSATPSASARKRDLPGVPAASSVSSGLKSNVSKSRRIWTTSARAVANANFIYDYFMSTLACGIVC